MSWIETLTANKITGANAGGPCQLPLGTRWAARVAQFSCWAGNGEARVINENGNALCRL